MSLISFVTIPEDTQKTSLQSSTPTQPYIPGRLHQQFVIPSFQGHFTSQKNMKTQTLVVTAATAALTYLCQCFVLVVGGSLGHL